MKHRRSDGVFVDLELTAGGPVHQKGLLHAGWSVDFEEIEHQLPGGGTGRVLGEPKGHRMQIPANAVAVRLRRRKSRDAVEVDIRFGDEILEEAGLDGTIHFLGRQSGPLWNLATKFPIDDAGNRSGSVRLFPGGDELICLPR